MPFEIIRNDITRVSADAIVNTANPYVAIGEGTDRAIYEAAGAEQLLAERAKIGIIRPGDAAVTDAFALDAKYIIHTVGPAWQGGSHGERETVAMCYRNSLGIAADLGCESVAFPLISSGTYGFPKDEALKIAVSEISSFLFSHEMNVYLVVYDRESFVISGKAFSDIRSFIEDRDVKPRSVTSNQISRRRRGILSRFRKDRETIEAPELPAEEQDMAQSAPLMSELESLPDEQSYRRFDTSWREDTISFDVEELYTELSDEAVEKSVPYGSMPDWAMPDEAPSYSIPQVERRSSKKAGGSLEDLLNNKEETFQQKLFRIIDSRGLTDPEVYKKANIDRKLFSKIRSDVNYNPSKKTAIALSIALRLNLDETTDLLRKSGLTLSPSSTFDIIIRYCIEQGLYDIYEINCLLFKFDQPLLGA